MLGTSCGGVRYAAAVSQHNKGKSIFLGQNQHRNTTGKPQAQVGQHDWVT